MSGTAFSRQSRLNFDKAASDACNRISLRYFNELARHLTDTAVDAARLGQDTEGLEQELKTIIDINNNVKTLKGVSREIAQLQEVKDAPEKFSDLYKTRLESYGDLSEFERFGESKEFGNFKQSIWEIEHPDSDMPPKKKWFKGSGNDDDDDEDDIEVVSSKTSYMCPLSLELLSDPHTSSVCHHSFSYKAIVSYLHNNPNMQLDCPVAGCDHQINLGVLSRDMNLARRVDRYRTRHADNNKDDDEYESV